VDTHGYSNFQTNPLVYIVCWWLGGSCQVCCRGLSFHFRRCRETKIFRREQPGHVDEHVASKHCSVLLKPSVLDFVRSNPMPSKSRSRQKNQAAASPKLNLRLGWSMQISRLFKTRPSCIVKLSKNGHPSAPQQTQTETNLRCQVLTSPARTAPRDATLQKFSAATRGGCKSDGESIYGAVRSSSCASTTMNSRTALTSEWNSCQGFVLNRCSKIFQLLVCLHLVTKCYKWLQHS